MSRPPPEPSGASAGLVAGGRKPRSADCSRCLVLRGLREAGLPAAAISSLCEQLWLTRARRRQLLFLEGNRATHLFVLRRGRVKLSRHDSAGAEHIVDVLQAGDLFGAEAMFGADHGTSAEALNDVEVCVGSKQEIDALLERAPGFAISLSRYLLEQLNQARTRQACLGAVGVRARLAAWLLHEVARRGDETGSVPHDLTLAEYGAILGTSAETVCRALKELRGRELVEVDGGQLRVLDAGRLARMARA